MIYCTNVIRCDAFGWLGESLTGEGELMVKRKTGKEKKRSFC